MHKLNRINSHYLYLSAIWSSYNCILDGSPSNKFAVIDVDRRLLRRDSGFIPSGSSSLDGPEPTFRFCILSAMVYCINSAVSNHVKNILTGPWDRQAVYVPWQLNGQFVTVIWKECSAQEHLLRNMIQKIHTPLHKQLISNRIILRILFFNKKISNQDCIYKNLIVLWFI